jgi:NADPH:quinone reductase
MQAWVLRELGEPADVLDLVELPEPKPAAHQTLVAVEGVGLAFPDLLRMRGEYQIHQPIGTPSGSELVGRVVACGSDGGFSVGDRVVGCAQIGDGALAELALLTTSESALAPEELPMPVAATIAANYPTAHLALHTRGKVQAGDIVLVTGGAGGVGSAASQLAVAAGARVIAVDLGIDRAKRCIDFGAHAGVDSVSQDLAAEVKAFSNGHGADVIIDTVGGDVFDVFRRCVADEGRVVVLGFTSGRIPELRANHLILRNFAVMGMNAFRYSSIFGAVAAECIGLATQGLIAPPIDSVWAFADAPKAYTELAEGRVAGRAVVDVAGGALAG